MENRSGSGGVHHGKHTPRKGKEAKNCPSKKKKEVPRRKKKRGKRGAR